MYLKQAYVENSGSLRSLDLQLSFDSEGKPKPLIMVGGNGSGKTNFLSLVADALFEAAATHYDNVLPAWGQGRAWFRLVGGRTVSVGASGSVSFLHFDDDGADRFFKEKAGTVDAEAVKGRAPTIFEGQCTWPSTKDSIKEFAIADAQSQTLFEKGVYTYFPSSRSEVPYWLNVEALPSTEFDLSQRFSKRLRKPIYVEHALHDFTQWLLGAIADVRTEIWPQVQGTQTQWQFRGDPTAAMRVAPLLEQCNLLIRAILNDDNLRFVWLSRNSPDKVAIARGSEIILPNLAALSAGQAILLGMFGTLLRYGDLSSDDPVFSLNNVQGICLIDEIDAHIHIDLQHNVLPKLVKLFQNVQFILSSHSPIFVLGMERAFGPEAIQVVEMPHGISVGAESYDEFGKALEAVAASTAFAEKVIQEVRAENKPIVFVEGETDGPYIKRAAELLGKSSLFDNCDIEWIGSKDENGQGFNTGKDAMKHALSVLKANPNLANRKVLLLNDNDNLMPDQDIGGLLVRTLPKNESNTKVKAGIENLLTEDAISEDFFEEKEIKKENGNRAKTWTLHKANLCDHLCQNGTAEQFAGFASALDIISDFAKDIGTDEAGGSDAADDSSDAGDAAGN